jgi:hypothetical protein
MVILQNPVIRIEVSGREICSQGIVWVSDTIEEISFCLILTNYGSQHVVHACFNMCFCTICIALSLH